MYPLNISFYLFVLLNFLPQMEDIYVFRGKSSIAKYKNIEYTAKSHLRCTHSEVHSSKYRFGHLNRSKIEENSWSFKNVVCCSIEDVYYSYPCTTVFRLSNIPLFVPN